MKKAAVYSGSKNIYEDMITSAKSLVVNSDVDVIYMLAEDDSVGNVPEYIKTINVSDQKFFKQNGPNMKSGYTYLAMMRAALCHVLEEDIVLSLDADTIAVEDISDVWNLDIKDNYFAASHEWHRTKSHGFLYTNTGVSLYNLKKLREGKADEVIDVLNRRYYRWVEQDVFNYLCQGYIYDMPGEYNANDWTEWKERKLIHYAGLNDWRHYKEPVMFRNLSWDDVERNRG